MDLSEYSETFRRVLGMTDEEYYQEMLEEILKIGTAEEKRLALMPKEDLKRIHQYGGYYGFSPDDPPNLNRLHQFVKEIIEQKLEEKFIKNEQFIAQHGTEYTDKMMDVLDKSRAYWKKYPDEAWLPYLYQDCLEFCLNSPELRQKIPAHFVN
jgi:hypothetical protein